MEMKVASKDGAISSPKAKTFLHAVVCSEGFADSLFGMDKVLFHRTTCQGETLSPGQKIFNIQFLLPTDALWSYCFFFFSEMRL